MNKVASGELDTYSFNDLSKGNFVAVYAQDPEENCGLPFWIGKVHELQPPIAENDSDDDDITEDDLEGSVIIHECIQTNTTTGERSKCYVEHKEHGQKQKGKRETATKKVQTKVAND